MANTQTFTGDGETTVFNFTFPFFGVNDIHASINNVEVTSTNFTITPNATPDDADIQYTGGTITFATAPANGATIKVWRHVERVRHIDYQPTLQPQSYQLNQDLNQCMEILKEQDETVTNIISIANIPTVADLLAELDTILGQIDTFLTDDDLTDLSTTVAGHTTSINTLNGYDYVIESQSPTAENNYTWYRKYKSGWVEQGGKTTQTATSSVDATIMLPVEMQDTEYTVTLSVCSSVTNDGAESSVLAQTVTTISLHADSMTSTSGAKGFLWEVKGMAA